MLLSFSNYLYQHEIYCCNFKPIKNIFNNEILVTAKFTVLSDKNTTNDVIVFLAVIKIIFDKTPYFGINNFYNKNTSKKITINFIFNRLINYYFFKKLLFDFLFFNNNNSIFFKLNNNIFFISFDILLFKFLLRFKKFFYSLPKIHLSLTLNTKNSLINNIFLARILKLPCYIV